MVIVPSLVCYIVAAVLFAVAAFPPVPTYPLMAIGAMFLALGHAVP